MRQFDFFDEGVRRVFENYELPMKDNAWSSFQTAAGIGAKSSSFLNYFILPGVVVGGLLFGMQDFSSVETAHTDHDINSATEIVHKTENQVIEEKTLILTETENVVDASSELTEESITTPKTFIKQEKVNPNNELSGGSGEGPKASTESESASGSSILSEIDQSLLKRETIHYKGTKYKLGAPSKFTPNNDNRGDIFMPSELANAENFVIEVSDYKDGIVFKSKDYATKWDGTVLDTGKKANQGDYTWRVLIISDDKQEMYQGKVKLVR